MIKLFLFDFFKYYYKVTSYIYINKLNMEKHNEKK
jgi:hypothetical protein